MSKNPFRYFKTSREIIQIAVMMYIRFPLSLRNVEDLLHERGIDVCHESVRLWVDRFGTLFARTIRKRRSQDMRQVKQWRWHLDEVFVKIAGETHYLWRAIDHEGEVLEAYVTKTRDKAAALKFLRKAMNVANVSVIGVNPDSPYQNVNELLEAMKANPDQVAVATAGLSSAGHNAMEAISQATGATYKHVTYDGGNPAVIATVSGETEVTTQLASEQAEMIRANRIRPLAVIGTEPLELAGFGTIPAITDEMPDISLATNYFGIWTPKDVPAEVLETMADNGWFAMAICRNEPFRQGSGLSTFNSLAFGTAAATARRSVFHRRSYRPTPDDRRVWMP